MNLIHTIRVNVGDRSGHREEVLRSGRMSLPKKLLRLIFGDFCDIIVLTPGQSVGKVEIIGKRGGSND